MPAQSMPPAPPVPTVLLTRPLPQAQRFAAMLRAALGETSLDVLICPLMATEFLTPDLPDGPFAALILTSETGAVAAGRLKSAGAALPERAYCVGERTAEAARSAGFLPMSADGDAVALMALIRAQVAPGRLLHLRGVEARGDVAETLISAGIETLSAVVYDQKPAPLTPAARAALAGEAPVVVPLFSARSARLLAETGPHAAPLWIAAMSEAVADATRALSPQRLILASRPDAPNMKEAVLRLLRRSA